MSAALEDLQPAALWRHFAALCRIPRISGHEAETASWLKRFAEDHGFACNEDQCGNVAITVPASAGCEAWPKVILQAHQDMVPSVRPGFKHDWLNDPVIPVIKDDGYVYAENTSLGADDGIGLCMILSLIEDPKLQHGPLTALFTVREETTLEGALKVTPAQLQGDYLINLDSEDDGCLFVSCAGSLDCDLTFNFTPRNPKADELGFEIKVHGLSGGHSGADIGLGRANAVALLCAVIAAAGIPCSVMSLSGGSARNAIPNSALMQVSLKAADVPAFKEKLAAAFKLQKQIYALSDPDLQLDLKPIKAGTGCVPADSVKFLSLIASLPLGALRWSEIDPEIVETSCSLGLAAAAEGQFKLKLMPRALNEASLSAIEARISQISAGCDQAEVQFSNRHSCWSSPADNHLIHCLKASYKQITGRSMKVTAIHAGLECAAFVKTNPELQLVSLGPTVLHPHSYLEHVSIQGTLEAYETMRLTLSSLSH